MAFNFIATSLHPKPSSNLLPPPLKHKHLCKFYHFSSCKTFAQSQGIEGGQAEEDPPVSFSGMHAILSLF